MTRGFIIVRFEIIVLICARINVLSMDQLEILLNFYSIFLVGNCMLFLLLINCLLEQDRISIQS